MKITSFISGTSRTEIGERARAAARQLLDDDDLTQSVITYGAGNAETVDVRRGRPASAPLPKHLQVIFTVEVVIEVPAP